MILLPNPVTVNGTGVLTTHTSSSNAASIPPCHDRRNVSVIAMNKVSAPKISRQDSLGRDAGHPVRLQQGGNEFRHAIEHVNHLLWAASERGMVESVRA